MCQKQITHNINFMKKVIIYARVSTTSQEYDRQLEELRAYCKSMGYEVVKEFAETASGAKKASDRVALSELLNYVDTHKVDKVVVYECSRFSAHPVWHTHLRTADHFPSLFKLSANSMTLRAEQLQKFFSKSAENAATCGVRITLSMPNSG